MALKLQRAKDRKERKESSSGEQQLIHTHPPAGISSTEGKAGMSAWKKEKKIQALLAQEPLQAKLAHTEDKQEG